MGSWSHDLQGFTTVVDCWKFGKNTLRTSSKMWYLISRFWTITPKQVHKKGNYRTKTAYCICAFLSRRLPTLTLPTQRLLASLQIRGSAIEESHDLAAWCLFEMAKNGSLKKPWPVKESFHMKLKWREMDHPIFGYLIFWGKWHWFQLSLALKWLMCQRPTGRQFRPQEYVW